MFLKDKRTENVITVIEIDISVSFAIEMNVTSILYSYSSRAGPLESVCSSVNTMSKSI